MPKKLNNKRKIYHKNYYKAQAIVRDPWFQGKISWLKNRFKEVGCPVPDRGFKTYDQYQKWRDRYWDTHSRMSRDPAFKAKEKEIIGGKEKMSLNEYNALEAFRNGYLPPVYGQDFREILEHFKINSDDRKFKDFLERYVFMGRTEYPTTIIGTHLTRNKKSGQIELFVRIFGYTKKEDIVNNWDFISKDQKHLPDYVGKSKEWEEFDRDLEIYNLYKKLRQERLGKSGKPVPVDREIFVEVHEKYKHLTLAQIRNIIAKSKKRLGE